MSRVTVFISVALVWFGFSVFLEDVSYIHMITGGGCALLIHWSTT